ncbi:hypothetical protein N7494_006701 [Penicillium frequentans]|uniref:Uncharacterized protein n=1 Tax=Penicillium frequentans TaxID=3151616 RepID=A0AAD6CWT3_9EURO|nr:hypothetical protein N7494_006701 [Penicillium glabrum]
MSSRVAKPKKTAKKDQMLAFKPEKPFSDEDWLAVFLQCVMMTGVKVDISKVATTMGVTTQYAKIQFLRLRKKFGFTHLVGSNLRGKVPTEAEDRDEDGEVKINDGSFDGFTDDFPSEDVV